MLIGVLAAVMLLCIVLGDRIPLVFQVHIYALCVQFILGILIQWNLKGGRESRVWRIAWATTSAIMTLLVLLILFLDRTGREGDPAMPPSLIGGMEPATAVLMIAINLLSYVYVFLWGAGFHRVIYLRKDMERIGELASKDRDGR